MIEHPLTIKHRREGTTAYISVDGVLDYSSAPSFRLVVSHLLDSGCNRLLIHSQGVTYCDSSGLIVIATAIRQLRTLNGSIGFIGCPSTFRQILARTRFDSLIQFYENICEAMENPS